MQMPLLIPSDITENCYIVTKKEDRKQGNSIISSIYATENCYSDTKKEDYYGD
jgi:hypothetical protein